MINGKKKSFQWLMKENTATVATAGFESGMTTVQNTRMRDAPSI